MATVTQLRKEIQKTRQRLNELETQLNKAQYRKPTGKKTEERRLKQLELELKRRYPNVTVDSSILRLVGTLSRAGSDRRLIAEAIADKYGK